MFLLTFVTLQPKLRCIKLEFKVADQHKVAHLFKMEGISYFSSRFHYIVMPGC